MSTYSIPELLQKWKLGELTVEQALGHVLQNCLTLIQRQTETEKRVQQLEQQLNTKP